MVAERFFNLFSVCMIEFHPLLALLREKALSEALKGTMRMESISSNLMGVKTVPSRFSPKVRTALMKVALSTLLVATFPLLISAQSVAQCQPTAPTLFPLFVDTTSTTPGWDITPDPAYAKTHLEMGDIDGDGDQEIVALNQGKVQLWHWIQTGWTPMAAFPNAKIGARSPIASAGFTTAVAEQINVADVDGRGQKEVIVYVEWSGGNIPPVFQEQVYRYNPYIDTWSMLISYVVQAPSYWFKARALDTQEERLVGWAPGAFSGLQVERFAVNRFVPDVATNPNNQLASLGLKTTCTQTGGNSCIGLSDITGDGTADLTVWADNGYTYVIPSENGELFQGPMIQSKIPQVAPNQTYTQTWQVNQGLLLAPRLLTGLYFTALGVYKWANNDFAAVSDPGANLSDGYTLTGPIPYTVTVYPNATATSAQIIFVGLSGVYDYPLTANASGQLTVGSPKIINADISSLQGYYAPGYSGYFRLATEGSSVAMIARSSQGVITRVPSSSATPPMFIDPEALTDRGYPKYTVGQLLAYEYIGANTAGNPDLRSLYGDPAVSWANIQTQIELLPAPPAGGGIALADFQFAQKQTIAEVAALQSVNLLFAATGQILTNTYLVKDASLSEITDVLSLPSQPDVASSVINDISTAFNGLGAAAEGVGAVFAAYKDLASALNNSGSVLELLGTITGDIATYTTSNPIAANSYDLKVALDNSALGALTANSCHQVEALSSWSQSKPIADGLLTGELPLDLNTQQDILEATQAIFQLDIWQALLPQKLAYVSGVIGGCNPYNCTFLPTPNYPIADATPANCNIGQSSYTPVSLILEDPSTHNYPNVFALNALFDAPPQGLGVNPSDVFFGNNGWSVPYVPLDPLLFANTDFGTISCNTITPTLIIESPDATSSKTATSSTPADSAKVVDASGVGTPPASSLTNTLGAAVTSLRSLNTEVEADHKSDVGFSQRMVAYLEVTISRLRQNEMFLQKPTSAIQLLNSFIAQSQWHSKLKLEDSKSSATEAEKAVAVRDALLAAN